MSNSEPRIKSTQKPNNHHPISLSPDPPVNLALPKIGITMGDPTGIGPEIIVRSLSMQEPFEVCRPVVFGDRNVLFRAIRIQNLSASLELVDEIPEDGYQPGKVFLLSLSQLGIDSLRFGQPDRTCGEAMAKYVEEAFRSVTSGKVNAITTCPINKQAMNQAGYSFPGHTEFLAHLARASSVAMMFLGSRWKIVLVTTHLPLKDVARWITADRILTTIRLTDEGMRKYFGVSHPRIALLGLNPHCGEGGLLGEEEKREILPAILEARSLGVDLEGPFPADSFFDCSRHSAFDAIIAMYHDQGLIPVKMLDFKGAVNFTLGLPFVRTSVDHGTAYDIAGKGLADPTNLIKAISTAANLLKSKINY